MIECYSVLSLTPRLGFHPCSALDCWYYLTVRQNFWGKSLRHPLARHLSPLPINRHDRSEETSGNSKLYFPRGSWISGFLCSLSNAQLEKRKPPPSGDVIQGFEFACGICKIYYIHTLQFLIAPCLNCVVCFVLSCFLYIFYIILHSSRNIEKPLWFRVSIVNHPLRRWLNIGEQQQAFSGLRMINRFHQS